jgi:hypothetical protein
MANPPIAAAFIFGYPLHAGPPTYPANKIIWAFRGPLTGEPLEIDVYQADSQSVAEQFGWPGSRGSSAAPLPGVMYGTVIDVPAPGCWRFVLRWGSQLAEIDLQYVDRG